MGSGPVCIKAITECKPIVLRLRCRKHQKPSLRLCNSRGLFGRVATKIELLGADITVINKISYRNM